MKKAFTLAETLIVLVLIGFLSVIVIRSLGNLQPDREKVMFKKAYSITERAVGELVNDENIYPYDPNNIGFRNTNSADVEGTTESYANEQKFCQFFARKLNTFENATFNNAFNLCTFQTTDGIDWSVMSDFQGTTERVLVVVDVNGVDKDPNFPVLDIAQVVANQSLIDINLHPELNREDRDRFYIYVHFDGRVTVAPNSLESEFLKSHESNKDR